MLFRSTQITLEDDLNIPDSKPDVSSINFDNGVVVIDEVKPYTDYVNVRGRLQFCVLYHTEEEGSSLVSLEGKISFDEKINMTGVQSTDVVSVKGIVEDLSVGIINSRKLSIQSLITLTAKVDEIYDEEAPIGIHGEDAMEFRKKPMDIAQIAICKNDIFRIKEEITLPGNYPNIFQILWSSFNLNDVEFKPLEEKISLQGDVVLFVLYEAEGDERAIRSFETTIPFSGVIDCHGCKENMIPDITYAIGQQDISIRPDLDGEERVIALEATLDISIKLYEEEQVDVITDIYGVTKEVETLSKKTNLRKLLAKVNGKMKVTDHIKIQNKNASILQLLHSEGMVTLEHKEITETGLDLSGSLQVKVMYITGEDEMPYASVKAQIPYHYSLEIPDIMPEDVSEVNCTVEQLQITMLDGEEMDVKAILVFGTTVFKNVPVELISDITIEPLDMAKLGALPGMAMYIVKPGDNLWNIGKKYYLQIGRAHV